MDNISISLDRESVCMGDDCNSHQRNINVNSNTLISEFIKSLTKYVPSMKNVVWAIVGDTGIIGYLITDEQANASIEVIGEDKTIGNCNFRKVMCNYYHEGRFTWIDGKSGKLVKKYPECQTVLEKVKKIYESKS